MFGFIADFLTPTVLKIGGVVLVIIALVGSGFYIENLRVRAAAAAQAKQQVAALQKASALLALQQDQAVVNATRIASENANLKAKINGVPDTSACLNSPAFATLLGQLHPATGSASGATGATSPAKLRKQTAGTGGGH